jgi:hypothetical protein
LHSFQDASLSLVAERLSSHLRAQLDKATPRLIVEYLEERLGPSVGVSRALPDDTRSLAGRLAEHVGLAGPGRLEIELDEGGQVRAVWTHERTMATGFSRFDARAEHA